MRTVGHRSARERNQNRRLSIHPRFRLLDLGNCVHSGVMTASTGTQTTTGAISATDHDGRGVVKPTPAEVMEDTGSGLDYGVRPDRMPDRLLTPTDRFYIRSHAPTPRVDAATWTLRVEGTGVRKSITYSYEDLWNRFTHV